MNPITVNISGTFSEKQRPNNGLEKVAPYLNTHRLVRVPIVGYVEWHTHGESRTGEKMAVIIPAIEPGMAPDGTDPEGIGAEIWQLLDRLRRLAKLGAVADTLFSVPAEQLHSDPDDDEPRFPGEETIPGADPIIRTGPDGDYVVPEASGEELTAELEERRAAGGAVPEAAFSASETS